MKYEVWAAGTKQPNSYVCRVWSPNVSVSVYFFITKEAILWIEPKHTHGTESYNSVTVVSMSPYAKYKEEQEKISAERSKYSSFTVVNTPLQVKMMHSELYRK